MKKIIMMIRELQDNSGVTSVIKNNYDKLINSGYSVDFCAMYDIDSHFRKYVISKGSNYFIYPQYNGRPDVTKENQFLDNLFKENSYDFIHVHITGKYALLALEKAKKNNIPYRIYHAHNPKGIRNIRNFIRWLRYNPRCIFYANNYFACSNDAGKSIFGQKKYSVIRNTIDVRKFKFDSDARREYRKELLIPEDSLVVGTVCRITDQKNPKFTFKIFEKIYKTICNSYLVWIGAGDKEQELKKLIEKSDAKDRVIFLGERNDVNKLYSVFDVFLLPSFYEGLGISFVEAQANGILTFASNRIPRDTNITDLIKYISLKKKEREWADQILNYYNFHYNKNKEYYNQVVLESGYDTDKSRDLLESYKEILNNKEKIK